MLSGSSVMVLYRMRMDVYYDHVYDNLSSENVPVIADVAEISFQAQAGGGCSWRVGAF